MGRRSHTQTLSIWANGQPVGTWSVDGRGLHALRYDPDWVRSPSGRPLSLSLPFLQGDQPHTGRTVRNYFDNLLPDSDDIRKRLATRFKTGGVDTFDLLKAIGRDCVGAVQLLGEDEVPQDTGRIQGVPMSDQEIEALLMAAVSSSPVARHQELEPELRISLAGAQDKTALLRWQGQWMLPRGSTPTTHILKPSLGHVGSRKVDFTRSVDNEWLCLRLLRAFGLPAAVARIETFESQRVLGVERFDRRPSADGRQLLRLPQEDFCQVEGCSSLEKYESEGGPGLVDIARTLHGSIGAREDLRTLLKAQLLFWMLRAPDQHAKNFSLSLLPRGRYRLTPLYDVLSAWPVMGDGANQWHRRDVKLAMALHGKSKHYGMDHILRRHFNSTARQLGFGKDMEPVIEEVLDRVPGAIDEAQADLPPDLSSSVVASIFEGLRASADALRQQPPD